MSRPRFLISTILVAVSSAALSACEGMDVPLPLRPMVEVAVGVDHSCGLTRSGEAYCWGDASSGQLGRGNTLPERFAARVDTDLRFESIVAGGWHTCALTADGTAYCWGANESGQLGTPGSDAVLEPRAVETDLRFTALSAGWAHTCGIAEAGTGYCWGRGSSGELGTGVIQESAPAPVAIGLDEPFVAVSAGGQHSCGVVESGRVYCWGANLLGQIGNAQNTPAEPAPVGIDVNRVFIDVAAGYSHSCAITVAGEAYCWGENHWGQLGNLDTANTNRPALVYLSDQEVYVQISAGRDYSCGVLNQGQAMCWGRNENGQLGMTGMIQHPVRQLVHVEPGRPFSWVRGQFRSVDAGGSTHTCGITIDDVALCWGLGESGQLGTGEWFSMIPYPVR